MGGAVSVSLVARRQTFGGATYGLSADSDQLNFAGAV